jgi:hypothetical protein
MIDYICELLSKMSKLSSINQKRLRRCEWKEIENAVGLEVLRSLRKARLRRAKIAYYLSQLSARSSMDRLRAALHAANYAAPCSAWNTSEPVILDYSMKVTFALTASTIIICN